MPRAAEAPLLVLLLSQAALIAPMVPVLVLARGYPIADDYARATACLTISLIVLVGGGPIEPIHAQP